MLSAVRGSSRQRQRHRPGPRVQDGHVLLTTLFTLLILATAATLVFSLVFHEQRQQLRSRQQLDLRSMNDSVIAETLASLDLDRDFGGVEEREFAAGTIQSNVREESPSRSQIRATAKLGAASAVSELWVTRGASGPSVLSWRRLGLDERHQN